MDSGHPGSWMFYPYDLGAWHVRPGCVAYVTGLHRAADVALG